MIAPFPFVGRVLHYREGGEIATERLLQLSDDLFLGHHLLARGAEGVKPLSYCFPVMPLTVLMESMAEVAGCLAPGCGIVGFEDVEAIRWVGFHGRDTLPLKILARAETRTDAADVHRVMVELFCDREQNPNARGTVLFGRQYRQTLDLAFPEPKNPKRYPLGGAEIYEQRHLFHGPIFQTIASRPILADDAVMGHLSVLPKTEMFRSIPEPRLVIDPLLLDGALQLFALWSIQRGAGAYPVGVRKVEFYSSPPAIGSTVPANVQVTHQTYRLLEGNIEIQNGSGHVWLRAQGCKAWLFHWTPRVSQFLRMPTRHCLSRDLTSPTSPSKVVTKCLAKADLGDLSLSACADHYLHVQEMGQFQELSHSTDEQLRWILGRIVAKDAVRQYYLALGAGTEMLHPASFTIEDEQNKEPRVSGPPALAQAPTIRITHPNGQAVCTAQSGKVP